MSTPAKRPRTPSATPPATPGPSGTPAKKSGGKKKDPNADPHPASVTNTPFTKLSDYQPSGIFTGVTQANRDQELEDIQRKQRALLSPLEALAANNSYLPLSNRGDFGKHDFELMDMMRAVPKNEAYRYKIFPTQQHEKPIVEPNWTIVFNTPVIDRDSVGTCWGELLKQTELARIKPNEGFTTAKVMNQTKFQPFTVLQEQAEAWKYGFNSRAPLTATSQVKPTPSRQSPRQKGDPNNPLPDQSRDHACMEQLATLMQRAERNGTTTYVVPATVSHSSYHSDESGDKMLREMMDLNEIPTAMKPIYGEVAVETILPVLLEALMQTKDVVDGNDIKKEFKYDSFVVLFGFVPRPEKEPDNRHVGVGFFGNIPKTNRDASSARAMSRVAWFHEIGSGWEKENMKQVRLPEEFVYIALLLGFPHVYRSFGTQTEGNDDCGVFALGTLHRIAVDKIKPDMSCMYQKIVLNTGDVSEGMCADVNGNRAQGFQRVRLNMPDWLFHHRDHV